MSLADARWARIEPLLPDRSPKRGGRWRDHRQVIDAIAFEFQTGLQWVHLPERYGNWRGVHDRLRMWAVDGTWERDFIALMAQADADGDLNRAASVDSTIVRAHQHAAGAREKGPRPASRTTIYPAGLQAAGIFLWPARRSDETAFSGGDREPPAGQAADSPGDGEGGDDDGGTDR
ncbi:IS5 family transposase [Streptomyces sp. Tue 6430]|nr:IS5 family transposase [Streptomyces sp. Tue 6430]